MSEDNEEKSCNSDTELNSKIMSFENVDKINKIISRFRIYVLRKKVKSLILKHKKKMVYNHPFIMLFLQ